MKKKIFAISGSTRKNASSHLLINYIREINQDSLDIIEYPTIELLPHFNPNLEQTALPSEVVDFRKLIEEADGVLICTPEYIFSLPGSLKNALEWTVSTIVFDSKPTALIVASALGEHAFQELLLIMKTMSANYKEDTTMLISGIRSKFDGNSELKDAVLKEKLMLLSNNFKKIMD